MNCLTVKLSTMRFYCIRVKDGSVHVQNAAGAMLGQHHSHSKEEFEQWKLKTGVSEDQIVWLRAITCTCGLQPGEVKQHDELPGRF